MKLRLLILFLILASLAPLCEAQGISLSLRLEPGEAVVGQPLMATFTLRNTGGEELRLPGGFRQPSLFFRVEIYDGDSRSIRYIGELASYSWTEKKIVPFRPSEIQSWTANLTAQFALVKAGDYKIAGVYEVSEKQCRSCAASIAGGMWQGRVEVEASFTLREPTGLDKEAYDYLFSKHKAARVQGVNDWNAEHNANQLPPSDDEIRAEIGRDFRLNTNALLEKFPSSLYTAYALASRYRLDRPHKPLPPEKAHLMTAGAVLARIQKRHLNPVDEYDRSVWPKDIQKKISELELIVQYNPDFVFIDRTYDALGLGFAEKLDNAKALYYFELAAKSAKNPELKARAQEFIEALKKPEKQNETAR